MNNETKIGSIIKIKKRKWAAMVMTADWPIAEVLRINDKELEADLGDGITVVLKVSDENKSWKLIKK